ncbi:MAG: T9SS type A sorting domain-containing protein [Flavobacteriales bacterium]|nr:T9SS type A sorting domain-containing protein [Flavobacteriales bacterium]
MTRFGRYSGAALLSLSLGPWTTAQAQDCMNEPQYPADAVTPNSMGEVTEIATCSFEEEHSRITGILATGNYEFTLSSGGYITVRQGAYDGPILGQGAASVQVNAATAEDLFAHWTVNDQCETAAECVVTTVQLLLDCTPAQATYTFAEDCDAQTYTILLDITSIGDAASIDVQVDVNGDLTLVEDQVVGVVELGPFPLTVVPVITLMHDADVLCNRVIDDIAFETNCPLLIDCGAAPTEQNYCYEPSDSRHWLYTSVGTGTLRLRFIRGTIESNNYDDIAIYDGTDATGTLLYQHDTTATVNLGGVGSAILNDIPRFETVDVFSTTGSLYMEMSSDGSVECGGEFPSEGFDSWVWEVTCLDCTLPEVSYTVADDCNNGQFSILMDVASTGDGATLELIYSINGGADQTVTGVGTGIAELGPFALNDTVNVRVVPAGSELCIVPLGDITDTGLCPLEIECGTEISDAVCYSNYADLIYVYQGTGTFPLGIFFDSGLLFFGDSLIIYDGDMSAPRLFEGTDQNVTDLFVNTTNPEHLLTVRIRSNDFTSCQDGFEPEELAWRVACLDCVPTTSTFAVVLDCANNQYFVDVNVSAMGSDAEAQIGNDYNSDTLAVTATGTYQVGPFPADTVVVITVVNDANSLCNVESDPLVNPVCPVIYACPGDGLDQDYCYQANDSHAWSYELESVSPTSTLRLRFIRGTIESNAYDHLTIYDGSDNTGTVLFDHDAGETRHLGEPGSTINDPNGVYPNFYSLDVGSTTGTLYMEMTSDGSVQCGGDFPPPEYDSWEWEVYCIDCANPGATFNVVPDCAHRSYSTEVIVTEAGGDDMLSITNLVSGDTLTGLGVGVHTFGPYPVDSASVMRVFNETFAQCRATSDSLTYTAEECVSVTCGFDNTTLCYENSDDRWYTYRSEQNVPMTIAFLQGQMVAGDSIILYNGADETAAVLYEGNNGGNLAGFALNSANAGNTITLRVKSDAIGSCDDGQVNFPLEWTVACGAVGLPEAITNNFTIYPNPTQGLLNIEMAGKVKGSVRVRVLDMSGRAVLDQPLLMNGGTRNTIDMRGLQSGNYLVQLTTEQWVKTQRVQVTR